MKKCKNEHQKKMHKLILVKSCSSFAAGKSMKGEKVWFHHLYECKSCNHSSTNDKKLIFWN